MIHDLVENAPGGSFEANKKMKMWNFGFLGRNVAMKKHVSLESWGSFTCYGMLQMLQVQDFKTIRFFSIPGKEPCSLALGVTFFAENLAALICSLFDNILILRLWRHQCLSPCLHSRCAPDGLPTFPGRLPAIDRDVECQCAMFTGRSSHKWSKRKWTKTEYAEHAALQWIHFFSKLSAARNVLVSSFQLVRLWPLPPIVRTGHDTGRVRHERLWPLPPIVRTGHDTGRVRHESGKNHDNQI